MGFPIISEVWDGIRWIIDFFIDKAPKPIKILFFLLLLIGLVAMIPFFLHLIGFHCNTSSEMVKLSPIKVLTNIRLAFIGSNEIINETSYIPDKPNLVSSCRKPVCYVNGTYYWQSDPYCDGQTLVYPYLTTLATWSRCGICQGDVNYTGIESSNTLGTDYFYLCLDDVFHINVSERNWYQRWICDEGDDCTVPHYYYYEYDTGTFDCVDLDICGTNNTIIKSKADDILLDSGGQLLYPDPDKKDYNSVVRLKCDKELSPSITFFGIPVFDYRIWLMLIVIYILFMFLTNIKKH